MYVVLRSVSGLAHMLSPSSCCQQISTCTSSSESTTSGMYNEKGLTEKTRESEKYNFKSQLTKLYFFFEYPRRINCQKKCNQFVCVCVTPSVVLRSMQRRRVLSRTNGGLQKQLNDPAVFTHTPFSQTFPNAHSS